MSAASLLSVDRTKQDYQLQCFDSEFTPFLPPFLQNTTCINPDYILEDFDPKGELMKVAFIGLIISAAIVIYKAPSCYLMTLKGRGISLGIGALYLAGAVLSSKSDMNWNMLATLVTLTLPVIFCGGIIGILTWGEARKREEKAANEQFRKVFEKFAEELEDAELTQKPELVGFTDQRSQRIRQFHQERVDREYNKLVAGTREAGLQDTTDRKMCAICFDYFELNQSIFSHVTQQGVEHIFHTGCNNRNLNNRLSLGLTFACPLCADSLDQKSES